MKNLPLWSFLAFRTIVESVSSEESMDGWGTNPPAATKNSFLSAGSRYPATIRIDNPEHENLENFG
jgi:hypothetical protein